MRLVVDKQPRLRLPHDLSLFLRRCGTFAEARPSVSPADVQGVRDKSQHVASQRRLFVLRCNAGSLDDAIAMFAHTSHDHILVWNAIIQVHSRRGSHHRILGIFNQMLQEGIIPDKVTFACVLSACTVLVRLSEGIQLHACIHHSKLRSNIIVNTALIDMHGKCGDMEGALLLFESLLQRDVVVFNAMMTCLLKVGSENLWLFEQMLQEGVMPNRVTYLTLIEACSIIGDGEFVYSRIISSEEYQADVALGNAFIHMYGRCNLPAKAQQFFFCMKKWDAVSFNTLIGVYCNQGKIENVLEFFVLMQEKGLLADVCTYITLLSSCASAKALHEGMCVHLSAVCSNMESNVGVSNALLSMYVRCGNVADALRMFYMIQPKTVVSWNAMIALSIQQDHYEKVMHLFYEMMEDGMPPDKVTFVQMMSTCSNAGYFAKGKSFCLLAFKIGYEMDPIVGSSLVNMYGKCGELKEARTLFFQISDPNVWSWNMVLNVYACHGDGKGMFQLFNRLQEEGVVPDDVTFVAVLSGCDHLGYISRGILFFQFMQEMYDILPGVAHYVCMIDLLGRAGQLEEAAHIIDVLPTMSDGACITALASAYNGYMGG